MACSAVTHSSMGSPPPTCSPPGSVGRTLLTTHVLMLGPCPQAMMYVIKPGYAISYLCGFDQIMTLREERRRALGEHFTLAGFHDELLRHGTIPISLIRYLNEQQGK